MMKILSSSAAAVLATCTLPSICAAQGYSCNLSADHYQESYLRDLKPSYLVCMQKAMEREMSGSPSKACPASADSYQERYLSNGKPSDLVCMQEAMTREMGG